MAKGYFSKIRPIGALAATTILVAIGLVAAFATDEKQTQAPVFSPRTIELAQTCQSCHGRSGISASQNIPNLAGQKQGYLATQLKAFKAGNRKHQLMEAIAGQLSDEEISGLASYWSAMPAAGSPDATGVHGINSLVPKNKLPKDFPQGFVAYDLSDDEEAKAITRHYANMVAITAARAGVSLPDGSMIVVQNLSAKTDASGAVLKDAAGKLIADKPTSFATMQSGAGWENDVPLLLRNGNWHYAQFDGAGALKTPNQAQCLACHKPIASDDYMFTKAKLNEFARPKQK